MADLTSGGSNILLDVYGNQVGLDSVGLLVLKGVRDKSGDKFRSSQWNHVPGERNPADLFSSDAGVKN